MAFSASVSKVEPTKIDELPCEANYYSELHRISRLFARGLKTDCPDVISEELTRIGCDDVVSFLNKPLEFDRLAKSAAENAGHFHGKMVYVYPLIVSVACGCQNLLAWLLTHNDLCLSVSEQDGSNVFHAVCWAAYFTPSKQIKCHICVDLLLERMSEDLTNVLMMSEEASGLRPLELACKLGEFTLIKRFLTIDGVYKKTKGYYGPWNDYEYDMSAYEGDRSSKSPLRMFCWFQDADLQAEGFAEFWDMPVVQQWIKQKVEFARSFTYMWFLGRFLFIVLALSSMIIDSNRTLDTPNTNTSCVGILFMMHGREALDFLPLLVRSLTFVYMAFDIMDGLHYFAYRRRCHVMYQRPGLNSPSFVINTVFHRVIQSIYLTLTFLFLFIQSFGRDSRPLVTMIPYVFVVNSVLLAWTCLFIVQHFAWVGHLVIGFQKVLGTFAVFSVLFLLLWMSFIVATYLLSRISCLNYDLFDTSYFSVQLFLSQININTLDVKSVPLHRTEWRLLHVLFVIIVSILLLNFCIAILSETSTQITDHKHIIQRLTHLTTALTVQDRLGWLIRPLYRKLHPKFKHGIVTTSEAI